MTDTFVQHCISLYSALDDRATIQELESGNQARVFAGNYGDVWESCKISRTYYTSVRKALERHNAILFLQRGGRGADTVIALQGLPESWDIEGWNDKPLTKPSESAKLEARIQEIEKKLGGINVITALAEFEKRVVTLEKAMHSKSNTKRNTKEK